MSIEIRYVEERDTAAVHQMFLSNSVVMGTMRLPVQSIEHTKNRLAFSASEFKMVATQDDQVIGFAELLTFPDTPRHAHAGELNMIATRQDHQGKGVANALIEKIIDMGDNWLNLHRIYLTVWEDNARAIALYERHGFQREGLMTDFVFRQGKYENAVMMGRIRPQATT